MEMAAQPSNSGVGFYRSCVFWAKEYVVRIEVAQCSGQ
jgi:hypothetical protein